MSEQLAHKAAVRRTRAVQFAQGLYVAEDRNSDHLTTSRANQFPPIESVLAAFDRSAPLPRAA